MLAADFVCTLLMESGGSKGYMRRKPRQSEILRVAAITYPISKLSRPNTLSECPRPSPSKSVCTRLQVDQTPGMTAEAGSYLLGLSKNLPSSGPNIWL